MSDQRTGTGHHAAGKQGQGMAFRLFLGLLCFFLLNPPSQGASLGMVADNASDVLRLFDIETGAIVASLKSSKARVAADCALSRDQVTGYSSHANRQISVYQLSQFFAGESVSISSIDISNAGVDMSLSPDGRLLVSVGAGNSFEPLSVVDTQSRTEVAATGLFLDHTSAEFCDDGTLLVTTTYGDSFSMPFDNAVYDARADARGNLQLGGNRLSSGAQPNNASCAPGSRAGVLLDRDSGLTSFTLPGLQRADYAELRGGVAVAAVYNQAGDRLFVRTTKAVEAFDFNPVTGVMKADWVRPVPFSSEYFGIDQIAIDPEDGKLYVDGGQVLLILDPHNGRKTGWVNTGDATGVCFAQRPSRSPIIELVQTAP